MAPSPADETAEDLDKLHQLLTDYAAGKVNPVDTPGNVGHVSVTLPAWSILRLWNGLRTASRQLRTLVGQLEGSRQRVAQLEATTSAQQVELARLRGTDSEALESLSRWASAFAAENGVDAFELHGLVQSQAEYDNELWARLDRERGQLEAYRLAVLSVMEQTRTACEGGKGLDARGVGVVLAALERAYRKSRG